MQHAEQSLSPDWAGKREYRPSARLRTQESANQTGYPVIQPPHGCISPYEYDGQWPQSRSQRNGWMPTAKEFYGQEGTGDSRTNPGH